MFIREKKCLTALLTSFPIMSKLEENNFKVKPYSPMIEFFGECLIILLISLEVMGTTNEDLR